MSVSILLTTYRYCPARKEGLETGTNQTGMTLYTIAYVLYRLI
jgi:hypothetical protein